MQEKVLIVEELMKMSKFVIIIIHIILFIQRKCNTQ